MREKTPLRQADERLAVSVVAPSRDRPGRRYRCDSCGLSFPADELNPDFNEDGKRIGWLCESCY